MKRRRNDSTTIRLCIVFRCGDDLKGEMAMGQRQGNTRRDKTKTRLVIYLRFFLGEEKEEEE